MSAAEPGAPRQEIWRTLLIILALYTISRAVFAAIGLLSHYTIGDGRDESLASLLCRWDCHWYLGLIEQGYTTASETGGPGKTSYAFFPVYPLLARALTTLGLTPLAAALWLANLAFIAALFYVQRYARLVGLSRQASLIAVALLCFVPHGFVFSAVYTESLFLLLLVAAMYHLRRGDYLVAGLAAALLSGVRANGIFFIVFALVFIVREFGWRSLVMPWQRPQVYVPVVLAPLGLFLFWAWCFYTVGDAFAQMSSVEQGWHWRSDLPWRNLTRHLGGSATERFWVLCSLAIGALSLLLLRARLYAEFTLCAAILCLLWSGQIANSLLRYSMVLFPVWLGLARELDKRPFALAAVIGVFGLFNGWLLVAWTLGALVSI